MPFRATNFYPNSNNPPVKIFGDFILDLCLNPLNTYLTSFNMGWFWADPLPKSGPVAPNPLASSDASPPVSSRQSRAN